MKNILFCSLLIFFVSFNFGQSQPGATLISKNIITQVNIDTKNEEAAGVKKQQLKTNLEFEQAKMELELEIKKTARYNQKIENNLAVLDSVREEKEAFILPTED